MRRMRPAPRGAERSGDGAEAVQRGLALLARRPRTAADLRERLAERFDDAAVEKAMARLGELGYVDDRAWAAAYVARLRSSERSARMLQRELRTHGIADDVARDAIDAHDDDLAAAAAVRRLARSSSGREPEVRRRRLRSALARRGFALATIERALARLDEEAVHAEGHVAV